MTEFEKELVRFVSGYLDAGVSTEDYVKAFSKRLLDSIGGQSKPKVSEDGKELIQVKVKPIMGYHKSCGFVATKVELEGYGVVCENGEGTIYIKK